MSREAEIWKEGLRVLLRQERDLVDRYLGNEDKWMLGYNEGKSQAFDEVLRWLDNVE